MKTNIIQGQIVVVRPFRRPSGRPRHRRLPRSSKLFATTLAELREAARNKRLIKTEMATRQLSKYFPFQLEFNKSINI